MGRANDAGDGELLGDDILHSDTAGNNHQIVQSNVAGLLLHLGNLSGFVYRVVFTFSQVEISII